MDPILSSAFPIHKIGEDGFTWFIGQVESNAADDPKNSGRYRVRIVGTHLKDCNATPTSQLPWANVMLPANTPWSDGGVTGSSIGLKVGSWIVGFFLDNDRQKPLILGSIGHTAGATLLENVENDPNPGDRCKSFTTFLDPERNPYRDEPAESKKNDESDTEGEGGTEGATKVGQAGQHPASVAGKLPAMYAAAFATASATNPIGAKVCVEIANPKCGSDGDLNQGLTKIIGDMLAANEAAGGKLGSYYVSQVTGGLNNYVNEGRVYVNKAVRLVKSFLARIKGEIVKLIKDGIDALVQAALTTKQASVDDLGNDTTGPVNPDLGVAPFQPVTVEVSVLKPIQDLLADILSELGCSIADLTDRIAQFITDLLLGYLMDAYRGVACLVDTLVNGILNEIISFLDSALASILGPLSEILALIAAPLDLLGSAIQTVFNLLGISCDGPGSSCNKVEKVCTDCDNGETDDNWLDDLLNELEDGPLDTNTYVCDEANTDYPPHPTDIRFIGGIYEDTGTGSPDGGDDDDDTTLSRNILYTSTDVEVFEGSIATFTIVRSGNVTKASSLKITIADKSAEQGVDFDKAYQGNTLGFAPGETTKTISFQTYVDTEDEDFEFFFIRLESSVLPENFTAVFPNGRDYKCTILDNSDFPTPPPQFDGPDTPPYTPPVSTLPTPFVPLPVSPSPLPDVPSFTIFAEKPFYYEGETAVFFVEGINVSEGDVYQYTFEVDEDDIEGPLFGEFTLDADLRATITTVIAENNDNTTTLPAGTVPQTDEFGNVLTDPETGETLFNEEDIIQDIPDSDEVLRVIITATLNQATTIIKGENEDVPAYFVRADRTFFSEGETTTFKVTTSNVPDETELTYTITGVDADDIDVDLTGTFIINDGSATVPVTLLEDDVLETTSSLLTFTVEDASDNVIVVGEAAPVEPDAPTPSYFVESDKFEYKEGEVIEYTITTFNVPDGTVLQYQLVGQNINPSDFVIGKLFGEVVIIDGEAKVYIGIAQDGEIETNESLRFVVSGTSAFTDVVILGEFIEGERDDPEDTKPIPLPCLSKPVAGTPITDSSGKIISIPIVDNGCPYVKPPRVIIVGEGYGASAIPLLDDQGRVSEIRVTRTGSGYRLNTPFNANVKCIIDSFTLINVGRGYTEPPEVIVNGLPNIARASINGSGYLTGVEILDRSLEVTSLPTIVIQGGGGGGGRVLANVVCLDNLDELAASGFAKIGTGKYIDCP